MTDPHQVQEIYSRLLAEGYQERLFADLPGNRKKEGGGRETLVDCPFCGRAGKFSYNREKPVWKCWSCGTAGDWLKYMMDHQGHPFHEALQRLADAAGVELEGADPEKHKAYAQRAGLLETAMGLFREALFASEGKPTLDYLQARGYTVEEIKAMGLGAYANRERIKGVLTGKRYSEGELRDSGILTPGLGDTHTLVIPWKDQAGRTSGLSCRALSPSVEPKYKYSMGLPRARSLVGFSRARGAEDVVLVEGLLDALYLHTKGFHAVAVGGTDLSAEQREALEITGTGKRHLLLAFDSDGPGQKATYKIIRSLSTSRLRPYVVSLPEGFKDPDQLIREKGPEAFQECLDGAERAAGWLAWYIASQHVSSEGTFTDRGLDRAVDEALEAHDNLEDGLDRSEFWRVLKESTGLTDEELAHRKQEHGQRASEGLAAQRLQRIISDLQRSVSEGDYTGAEVALAQGAQDLRQSRGVELPEPYLVEDLTADLQRIGAGLKTGLNSLDAACRIPQGQITLLGARPRHGKTTLSINLLVNMLRLYPDKAFYYFSYEEPRRSVALRTIVNMAGAELDPKFNQGAYVNYLKGNSTHLDDDIDRARERYASLAAEGRLVISDAMPPAEDLATLLDSIARVKDIGAVFVDYVQKIPLRHQPRGERYLAVARASSLLLEQAVRHDIPIIMAAQFRRPSQGEAAKKPRLEDLRESGDLEQDAHLVLGLYIEGLEEGGEETAAKKDFQVMVLKNRAGVAGQEILLDFDGPTLRITG